MVEILHIIIPAKQSTSN